MIVTIGIISKKKNVTAKAFCDHFSSVDRSKLSDIPGLMGYSRNHIVGTVQNIHEKSDMAADLFEEIWFEDLASMENCYHSNRLGPLGVDAKNDVGEVKRFVCEYHIIVPVAKPGGPLYKRMSFITMQPHVTEETIRQEWLGVHSKLAGGLPGIKGYAQSLVIDHPLSEQTAAPADKAYLPFSPIDGFAELWFENERAMAHAFASPTGQKALTHAQQTGGRVTTFQVESNWVN